jgi:hypothetical protein
MWFDLLDVGHDDDSGIAGVPPLEGLEHENVETSHPRPTWHHLQMQKQSVIHNNYESTSTHPE